MSLEYRPTLGDLVIVHDPQLAAQLHREGQLGVVVQLRRNDVRVLFLPGGEAFWIARHRLHPHPRPASIGPAITVTLGEALALLQPDGVEPEELAPHHAEVSLACRSLPSSVLETLQQRLGARLARWEARPYGMALLTLRLTLVDPAGVTAGAAPELTPRVPSALLGSTSSTPSASAPSAPPTLPATTSGPPAPGRPGAG
jgi:hypothetical protein